MEILDCVHITQELVDTFAPLIPEVLREEVRKERAFGLGSMLGDMPNGAVVFRIEGNFARVLSLYVDRYDRRNGTGRFLMGQLRAVLREMPRIYSIRTALPAAEEGIETFFEQLGARLESADGPIRFSLSVLEHSPLRKAPKSPHCVAGTELNPQLLSHYQRTLVKSGEYLMEQDLTDSAVRQELSRYYLKGNKIQGCAVMTERQDGLTLAMLVNQGGVEVLPLLLGSLVRGVLEHCPPETKISLEAVTPESRTLLERIIPTAERSTRRVAVLPV